MTDRPWYHEGLRFTCQQCGNCCRGPDPGYVWVTEDEIAALAKRLDMSLDAFGRRYLRRVGARYTTVEYQSSHVSGGAIAGASPDSSVVNPWMQHWNVPNLWVVGSSGFPQNSSGNPTVTILAMAYRAADAMVSRYFKHAGALA